MSFEQEKMIVESLPSLYPLQKFEEEAINTLVSLPIDDDVISRKAAIELCDWYDNTSMREDLEKLRPVRFSTNTISRAKAIEALKNDMASLDHIIKGMSANDVRLDAYVSQRNQVNYDIYTINNLPPVQPAQLGTNLAEVGTDCISRAKAIEALDKRFDSIPMEQTSEILMLRKDLRELPPAQPPMPSNTSNALETLDSVNATQSNTLEASDCDPSQIAAQIIHDAIDNTTFAEDAYPGIKEQLHRSVEEWEKLQPVFTEIAEEYKKACEISYINEPLAYALHEVWKKHDRRDTNRNDKRRAEILNIIDMEKDNEKNNVQ